MFKLEQNTITSSTVATVWHQTRGHNYVAVGIDADTNELLFIKNNCINSDGSVHRSTNRFHLRRPVTTVGGVSTTRRVSTAVGFRELDTDAIKAFAKKVGVTNFKEIKKKNTVLCSSMDDRRSNLIMH